MRVFFRIAYWFLAVALLVAVLLNLNYTIRQACIMVLIISPLAFALEFSLHKVVNSKHWVYISVAIIGVVMICILLYRYFVLTVNHLEGPSVGYAGEFTLPIVAIILGLILISLSVGDYFWGRWLSSKYSSSDATITFFSDRKSVTMKISDIIYIESNDTEVRIITSSGESYRNKTNISTWERDLGERFLRIHRSYLVNLAYSSLVSSDAVEVGEITLPVSRKYKDAVAKKLNG